MTSFLPLSKIFGLSWGFRYFLLMLTFLFIIKFDYQEKYSSVIYHVICLFLLVITCLLGIGNLHVQCKVYSNPCCVRWQASWKWNYYKKFISYGIGFLQCKKCHTVWKMYFAHYKFKTCTKRIWYLWVWQKIHCCVTVKKTILNVPNILYNQNQ